MDQVSEIKPLLLLLLVYTLQVTFGITQPNHIARFPLETYYSVLSSIKIKRKLSISCILESAVHKLIMVQQQILCVF